VLSSLLTTFRQQYPTGNLISNLLTIHDGQYVVQVVVQVEGQTLGSGLAAHSTLETAEDRAYTRALERLALPGHQPSEREAISVNPPEVVAFSPAPGVIPEEVLPETVPEPKPMPLPLAKPADEAIAAFSTLSPLPPKPVPSPDHKPMAPPPPPSPIALVSPLPQAEVPQDQESQTLLPPEPPFPNADPSALADPGDLAFPAESTTSIDLSDIIAQTDVELQRLGWDVNQGREFLEKTYGKRSRHDLTDEELLEFLLYLEAQPSPSHR
jgi:hypothetical protein